MYCSVRGYRILLLRDANRHLCLTIVRVGDYCRDAFFTEIVVRERVLQRVLSREAKEGNDHTGWYAQD